MSKETSRLLFFIPVIPLIAGIFCLLSNLDKNLEPIMVPDHNPTTSSVETTDQERGIEPFHQITFYELPEPRTSQATDSADTVPAVTETIGDSEKPSVAETEKEKEPAGEFYEENYNNESSNNKSLGVFTCVAYCGCSQCSDGFGNITALGTICRPNHTIAVDPTVIPYGTCVVINGITYVAEDCGGAIIGNTIDIYFENHAETVSFGIRQYEVFLA